jgi:hypothetical protein
MNSFKKDAIGAFGALAMAVALIAGSPDASAELRPGGPITPLVDCRLTLVEVDGRPMLSCESVACTGYCYMEINPNTGARRCPCQN